MVIHKFRKKYICTPGSSESFANKLCVCELLMHLQITLINIFISQPVLPSL